MSERERDLTGRVNVWDCSLCGTHTVGIHIEHGVTPFAIKCPTKGCPAFAHSQFYPPELSQDALASTKWEWYLMTPEEARKAERRAPGTIDHVNQGGLSMRPLTEAGRELLRGRHGVLLLPGDEVDIKHGPLAGKHKVVSLQRQTELHGTSALKPAFGIPATDASTQGLEACRAFYADDPYRDDHEAARQKAGSLNPYEWGTVEHADWRRGWNEYYHPDWSRQRRRKIDRQRTRFDTL